MHIDKYEGAFLWLAGVMLTVFAGAVVISAVGLNIHLPGQGGQIDPQKVTDELGFSTPGLTQIRPGVYEAYLVVQAWQFNPSDLGEVPVGSTVHFFLSSLDVIHAFKMFDTNINIMVIPGQVSQVSHTFTRAGIYHFLCYEYCGTLHHTMYGQIKVVEGK
jgi:cytochrome c oxidase subunit 2